MTVTPEGVDPDRWANTLWNAPSRWRWLARRRYLRAAYWFEMGRGSVLDG